MDFPAIFKCRLLFAVVQLCLALVESVEICNLETFKAECAPGHVIMMTSAKYGLMRRNSRCIKGDVSTCSADVLSLSDMKCSGRNKCEIPIPDNDFEEKAPSACSMMKLYYEATYKCVKVQFVRNKNCQRCDYIPVSDNTGLIASSVTQETRCGSEQCPWLIKVDEGQKVKLSLFDYMTVNGIQSGSDGTCNAYMEIKDGDQRTPFNICRDRARGTKHLYTSVSNRVYVNIHVPSVNSAKKQERGNFLLKYEVTGCRPLQKPDYGWVRYDDKYAYIGCNATGKESTLICKNTTWTGHHMNCSIPAPIDEVGGSYSITNLLVVVIIAGVAVCMCSCVVVIGLCCFKGMSNKRRHERFPPPPPYDVSYEKHAAGGATESHVMLTHKDDPDLQKPCDIHGTIRHVDHVKTKQGYRKEEAKDHTLNRGHQTLKPAKHHYEQIWEKQHAKTAHMKNTL